MNLIQCYSFLNYYSTTTTTSIQI